MPGMPGMPGMGGGKPMSNEEMAAQLGVPADAMEEEGFERAAAIERQQRMQKQVQETDFTTGEWCTLYPIYIDKAKTVSQGRRLPVDQCCDFPIADEMASVLFEKAKFMIVLERGKAHPRDPTRRTGRIRVKYRNSDSEIPVHLDFPTKRSLLEFCGQHVPSCNIRKQRLAQRAEHEKRLAAALAKQNKGGNAKGPAGSATASGASKKKKKGKR
ncbi:Signal recognition particle 19 kDa protein [Hondaea fermentalgiana]|uniref:Signal recognition particle 19 kDa protein n=1 Tax=Hondaea fermentalgiana TaxID=2315210 RepID=A0A2R5GB92_9STRA|nr:Signal recognition particle 19 kDa protein [Hondaea fermentalgiana]|eukprot:GBG25381.1 Signal recognition particle 19 kDa protein [Hondaea fermentalgiana]